MQLREKVLSILAILLQMAIDAESFYEGNPVSSGVIVKTTSLLHDQEDTKKASRVCQDASVVQIDW